MAKKRNIIVSVITQVLVSVVLLTVAGSIFWILLRTKPLPAKVNEPPQLRRVEVMEAVAVPVRRQWQGFGTARPRDEADIPAQVTAVVMQIPQEILEGAPVGKGQVFALLDETDFVIQLQVSTQRISDLNAQLTRLDLEQTSWTERVALAVEDVKLAEVDYERVRAALQKQAARQREVDQARQRLMAAIRVEVGAKEQLDLIAPRRSQVVAQRLQVEALLRLAKKNVERCMIRSPIDGFIAAVDIEVGESLVPGQRVARVVNIDVMEIPLRLPAGARPAVAVGDHVTLAAQGTSRQAWTGQVRRISPVDDLSTRTMTVYVELEQDPNEPGWLAPGRFVQGTVVSQIAELRYVVPRRSLLGDRLLVVEDGAVRSRTVHVDFHVQGDFAELGVVAEQWAVLVDPLTKGSKVVVNAARTLHDGVRVEPISLNGESLRDAPVRSQTSVPGIAGVPR